MVPPKLQPFLGERIIIEIWQCQWEDLSKEARLLVVSHELEHVKEYEGRATYDRKYKLQDHDVQEFAPYIENFGIHWTRRGDLPNILKEHVKIKSAQDHTGVLG